MFCKKCGKQLPDTIKFCDACGTPTGAGQQGAPMNRPVNPGTTTASFTFDWFKILTNIAIFVGSLWYFVAGILLFCGTTWVVEGESASSYIYEYFATIQNLDILYGLVAIALAGYGVYVRFELLKYKKSAVVKLHGLNIAAAVFGFTYCFLAGPMFDDVGWSFMLWAFLITSLIYAGVGVYNYLFFKQNAHKFVK
ncbi:MAG: zinc ribbon domain-containing protein [Clostridia bacterium]|nr:zinc ribbon domain-containing protein [Clostridia bacterium]